MDKQRMVIGSVVGAAAAFAGAQVTPIGEFTGDADETFEMIAPPGPTDGPAEVFGGQGTAYDNFTNSVMIATSLFSSDTEETIFPFNGNFMGGSVTGRMTFEFDTPVTDFGGFIGTVDVLEDTHALFRNEDNQVIQEVPFELPINEWDWYGWHSDEPISSVEFIGNVNPGTPIVFDDMQVSFVPAPAGTGLLAIGGLLAAPRRRR